MSYLEESIPTDCRQTAWLLVHYNARELVSSLARQRKGFVGGGSGVTGDRKKTS